MYERVARPKRNTHKHLTREGVGEPHLKTSPNLSETNNVWASAVKATAVGFLGSSLKNPSNLNLSVSLRIGLQEHTVDSKS